VVAVDDAQLATSSSRTVFYVVLAEAVVLPSSSTLNHVLQPRFSHRRHVLVG
jgi:hypothetical protein